MEWPQFDFEGSRRYGTVISVSDSTEAKVLHSTPTTSRTRRSLAMEPSEMDVKKRFMQSDLDGKCSSSMLYSTDCTPNRDSSFFAGERRGVVNSEVPLSPVMVNGFLTSRQDSIATSRVSGSKASSPDMFVSYSCTELNSNSTPISKKSSSHTSSYPLFTTELSPILPLKVSDKYRMAGSDRRRQDSGDSAIPCRPNEEASPVCLSEQNLSTSSCEEESNYLAGPVVHADNSSSLHDTLPPSQCCTTDPKSFSEISNSSVDSERNIRCRVTAEARHSTSADDFFNEQSDCFSDATSACFDDTLNVTINESEDSDRTVRPKNDSQNSPAPAMLSKVQPVIDDYWENRPVINRRNQRLTKLAEAMKKRMDMARSDVAMWKCEDNLQTPARRILVTSVVSQWGLCWCRAVDTGSGSNLSILDSGTTSKYAGKHVPVAPITHSISSLEGKGNIRLMLYHPLVSTECQSSEVLLAPRYYRPEV